MKIYYNTDFKKAKELGIKTFELKGINGRKKDNLCATINVPSIKAEKIQECHIMIGHIICSLIEKSIFIWSVICIFLSFFEQIKRGVRDNNELPIGQNKYFMINNEIVNIEYEKVLKR